MTIDVISQITSQVHLFLELALVQIRLAESWKSEELDTSFDSVHKTKLVFLAYCLSLKKRIEKISSLIANCLVLITWMFFQVIVSLSE